VLLTERDGKIVVVDDGIGMDEKGVGEHWLIGVSNKRGLAKPPKSRKQIGKFGIGNLATF
jgi:HSP90 family molecular chaperone